MGKPVSEATAVTPERHINHAFLCMQNASGGNFYIHSTYVI